MIITDKLFDEVLENITAELQALEQKGKIVRILSCELHARDHIAVDNQVEYCEECRAHGFGDELQGVDFHAFAHNMLENVLDELDADADVDDE